MKQKLPPVYLITDRHQVTQGNDYFAVIEKLLAAGVKMIQLREKDLPALDLYRYSVKLRSLTHKYDSLLVINDRIDIARAIGADGVHLGRASLPVDVARRQLGDGALVGVSTHSLEEARAAEQDGASFITYGPVFYTPLKLVTVTRLEFNHWKKSAVPSLCRSTPWAGSALRISLK